MSNLANLPKEQQVELLTTAAAKVAPRSVKGKAAGRFYCYNEGLSPVCVKALRDTGHGEEIFSGSSYNSRRWYFPAEILEIAEAAAEAA